MYLQIYFPSKAYFSSQENPLVLSLSLPDKYLYDPVAELCLEEGDTTSVL